jgi:5-methylcytosine-specific restriction endonuclease McrA
MEALESKLKGLRGNPGSAIKRIIERVQCGDVFLYRIEDDPTELVALSSAQIYDSGRMRRTLVVGSRRKSGSVSKAIVKRLLEAQERQCLYCYRDLDREEFHVDHIVPLAVGGTNEFSNLAIACKSCNLRKGALVFPDLASIRDYLARRYL